MGRSAPPRVPASDGVVEVSWACGTEPLDEREREKQVAAAAFERKEDV